MNPRTLKALLCSVLVTAAAALPAATGNITLSVRYADIAEVFEMLSREGRVNILLSNAVTGDVSVNLYDVDLDQAVRTVAAAAGYAVEEDDGTYFIVSREEAGKDIAGGLTRVRSFKVQYSDPNLVTEIIKNHLSRYGKVTALIDRKLLIIEDLPDFLDRVETILAELDRQPIQILIEARILEITLDSTDTYGVEWRKLFASQDGSGIIGTQGFTSATAPGLFFSLFNSNLEAVLNALSTKGRVQTLSTPKLLALEHEEAEVVIGEEIGYRVTTTINQISTESVEFLQTGIIMRVRSYVDRNGRIMMDIHPEVSSGSVSLDGVPSKRSTEVTTQLLAEDGQTIFIGGLIRNSATKRRDGIPVLNDIPVLGKLFGSGEQSLLKTETVVLITPRIIHERRFAGTGEPDRKRLDELHHNLEHRSSEKDQKLGLNGATAIEGGGEHGNPVGPDPARPEESFEAEEYTEVATSIEPRNPAPPPLTFRLLD